MRTYLVVMDETDESSVALRFAARRAAKTGGAVMIIAIIPPSDFVAWGNVQATIEEEARHRAEALVHSAAGTLIEESGISPSIVVKQGDPIQAIRDVLAQQNSVAALVLGAAITGGPGPLVSHFTGAEAGNLPCPVMIIPGRLSPDELDRLS